MKRMLFLCAAGITGFVASHAQDVITTREGDEIQAKVLDITTTEVKYKKWSNLEGPSYSVLKSDIFMIKYQNGEKDVFKDVPKENKADNNAEAAEWINLNASMLDDQSAAVNQQYIDRINKVQIRLLETGKKAGYCCMMFAADENSVISTENVQLGIVTGTLNYVYTNKSLKFSPQVSPFYVPTIQVLVKNISDKTLYIDLGRSFFVRNGKSSCYYIPSVTNTTQSGTSGGSVNLGGVASALGAGGAIGALASGVNVGRSSTNTSSTITYNQRIVAVPPHSDYAMDAQVLCDETPFAGLPCETGTPGMLYKRPGGVDKTMQVNHFIIQQGKNNPWLAGEAIAFDNQASPFKFSAVVSYSLSDNLESGYTMPINLYVKQLIPYNARNGSIDSKDFPKDGVFIASKVGYGSYPDFVETLKGTKGDE